MRSKQKSHQGRRNSTKPCDISNCKCKKKIDNLYNKEKKRRKHRKSLKPCKSARPYLHKFVEDLWCYLTPEIVDKMKALLMKEFGMKEREAEEFLMSQRMKSFAHKNESKKEKKLPCFPFPPCPPDNPCPPCPPPIKLPCLPFPCPPFSSVPLCPPPPCPPPPCPPPPCLSLLCPPLPCPPPSPPCTPPKEPPPCPPTCFPFPPFPCPPPIKLPCSLELTCPERPPTGEPCPLPSCFKCPPFLCPPFPCPPCPPFICPPPPDYPCCISPKESVTSRSLNKKKFKRKLFGLRRYWAKEFTNILTIRLNDYVAMLLSARRSNRVRCISEQILKHLCDISGEKFTMNTSRTRAQKIMVFIADRIAMWLADISCSCDTDLREFCKLNKSGKSGDNDDGDDEGDGNNTGGEGTNKERSNKGGYGKKQEQKVNIPSNISSGKQSQQSIAASVAGGTKDDEQSLEGSQESEENETQTNYKNNFSIKTAYRNPEFKMLSSTSILKPLGITQSFSSDNAYFTSYSSQSKLNFSSREVSKVSNKINLGEELKVNSSVEKVSNVSLKKGQNKPFNSGNIAVTTALKMKKVVKGKVVAAKQKKMEKIELTKKEQEKERLRINEKKHVKDVLKEILVDINDVKPVESERADEIATVVSKKLEKKFKTSADDSTRNKSAKLLDRICKNIGSWVDKMTKEAENEFIIGTPSYGIEGNTVFQLSNNVNEKNYSVKKIPSNMVRTSIDEAITILENNVNEMEVISTKSISVTNIKQPLDSILHGGDCIEEVRSKVELKFSKNNEEKLNELQKWKMDTKKHGIQWKLNNMFFKDTVEKWRQKISMITNKYNGTNTTDSNNN